MFPDELLCWLAVIALFGDEKEVRGQLLSLEKNRRLCVGRLSQINYLS